MWQQKFQKLINGGNEDFTDFLALPETESRLMKHFDSYKETDLLDILGSGFCYLSTWDISQNEGLVKCYKKSLNVSEKEQVCPLGIRWHRRAYASKFAVDEAVEGPLKNGRESWLLGDRR